MDALFTQQLQKEKVAWLDLGRDNYASVSFDNVPDNKRIIIGWMSNWDYAQQVPTNQWRGTTTIARELKLIKNENHYSLISEPVHQLENYTSKSVKKKEITANEKVTLAENNEIDLTKAVVELSLKDLESATYIFVLSNKEGELLTFGINNAEHYLFIDRSKSGKNNFSDKFYQPLTKAILDKNQKEAVFKIILDKTSLEIFFNNGEKVMTDIFFNSSPFTQLDLLSEGKINVQNLEINQININ